MSSDAEGSSAGALIILVRTRSFNNHVFTVREISTEMVGDTSDYAKRANVADVHVRHKMGE
jgi:hypothetical protein